MPIGGVFGGIIILKLKANRDNTLRKWTVQPTMVKAGSIEVRDFSNHQLQFTQEFVNAYAINQNFDFDYASNEALSTSITITAGIVRLNKDLIH